MKRMNFRQRISWLFVGLYLTLTCALFYYIFEISDRFNTFALDHVNRYHKVLLQKTGVVEEVKTSDESSWSFLSHVADVPLVAWLFIFLVPYLQIFAMLLACTKPSPQFSMAYMWPIYSFMYVQQKVFAQNQWKSSISTQSKDAEVPLLAQNAATVINPGLSS